MRGRVPFRAAFRVVAHLLPDLAARARRAARRVVCSVSTGCQLVRSVSSGCQQYNLHLQIELDGNIAAPTSPTSEESMMSLSHASSLSHLHRRQKIKSGRETRGKRLETSSGLACIDRNTTLSRIASPDAWLQKFYLCGPRRASLAASLRMRPPLLRPGRRKRLMSRQRWETDGRVCVSDVSARSRRGTFLTVLKVAR